MSLYLFYGSERNLNRKGHRHVQTGRTIAGWVRKRTRKRARKRAGQGGQDMTQGQISTETYKRRHRIAKLS